MVTGIKNPIVYFPYHTKKQSHVMEINPSLFNSHEVKVNQSYKNTGRKNTVGYLFAGMSLYIIVTIANVVFSFVNYKIQNKISNSSYLCSGLNLSRGMVIFHVIWISCYLIFTLDYIIFTQNTKSIEEKSTQTEV